MSVDLANPFRYDPADIARLAARYRRGGPLERAFYTAPEVFEADLDRIWRRYWLYAGHACTIPNAGDWFVYDVGPYSVIVTRGKDGDIRAFHNTCRHRGARLCNHEQGHSRLFVCPYHAWTYDLDGSLRTRTKREFGRNEEDLGLIPVKLHDVAGLIFIALGDDPVSFDAAIADIAPKMKHQGLYDAKPAHTARYVVNANWKLVFENNRECYHCASAHPEYITGTYDSMRLDPANMPEVERQTALAETRFKAMGLGDAMSSSMMTGEFWRAARTPLMEGFVTQSIDGRPVSTLMGTFRERGEWSAGTMRNTVFPNYWQHASDDHACASRLTALDAKRTEVVVTWYVHKDAVEGKDYDLKRLLPFWQKTSEQDWSICEANQKGVSSPAYRPGPYGPNQELNVQQFVDWYLGALVPLSGQAMRAAE
jgi:phenylpropionate dioxygenase-like ring-hydroxylating dioxygenase large terminal subunit